MPANFIVRGGADFSSIKKALEKTQTDLSKFQTGIQRSIKNAFGGVSKMIAAAFSIRAVINFAKTSITSANDTKNAFLGLQSIVEGQGRSYDSAKRALEAYI